jgi:hypothetical protein
MTLMHDVRRLCARLAPLGWGELFAAHGLDLTAPRLERELARPLKRIDRTLPGFEDFCREGIRGIEPGVPACSLLYHALASPGVGSGPRRRLQAFPTLAELETVENYIFAARHATLESLARLAGSAPMAIGVFAAEYRMAPRTAHRRYADMVYSRTGVARIGTAPPRYDAALRGFTPIVTGRPGGMRVCPVRYGAYLAIRLPGSQAAARPMRYRPAQPHRNSPADARRAFWVPLHKLFDGPECLTDIPRLAVDLTARHVNEKLRRIHLVLAKRTEGGKPFRSGWTEPAISSPPFRFSGGIAELHPRADDPPGLLVPVPHPTLVEPARFRGKPLGFNVPSRDGFAGSLDMDCEHNDLGQEVRPAPAYVHARTRMTAGGEVDLNSFADVAQLVDRGGYRARHYVDYTGDGWIQARVRGAAPGRKLPPALPAYSLVTAPDFLFGTDQADVSDWSDRLPPHVRDRIWYMAPTPLSDERLPANLQMPATPFTPEDDTITAVVPIGLPLRRGRPTTLLAAGHPTHTSLPDDAAGIMAPGWDVARDWLPDHRQHLASYGLGSPFPEDSKLCAALSAFWPAVAPDATREFAWTENQGYRTITPLTDEEIGLGTAPAWDNVPPPRLVRRGGRLVAVYPSLSHTDYVRSALAGRLTLHETGKTSLQDFQDRTLAMATAYRALGGTHFRWIVLSYRQVGPHDAERRRAERATGHTLNGTAHRFAVFYAGNSTRLATPPFNQEIEVRRRATLLVDPSSGDVLTARKGRWAHNRVSWR